MGFIPLKAYLAEVEGIFFKSPVTNGQKNILSECRKGEELNLIYSPSMIGEDNVKVCRKNGQFIGWLPEDLCRKIAPLLSSQSKVKALIYNIDFERRPFRKFYKCIVEIITYNPGFERTKVLQS